MTRLDPECLRMDAIGGGAREDKPRESKRAKNVRLANKKMTCSANTPSQILVVKHPKSFTFCESHEFELKRGFWRLKTLIFLHFVFFSKPAIAIPSLERSFILLHTSLHSPDGGFFIQIVHYCHVHHLSAHSDMTQVHMHNRNYPHLSYAATESLRVSYGTGAARRMSSDLDFEVGRPQ